jgi:hypothetical protein
VRQHPDEITIGIIVRGFDFLGYRLSATGLTVATQTVERCAERVYLLDEQVAAMSSIREYVRR